MALISHLAAMYPAEDVLLYPSRLQLGLPALALTVACCIMGLVAAKDSISPVHTGPLAHPLHRAGHIGD